MNRKQRRAAAKLGETQETSRVGAATIVVSDAGQPRTKKPVALQAKFQQGLTLHQQGRLAEAEQAYVEVLRQEPRYFDALMTERCIAAEDARVDPRTSQFTEGYLDPLGIGAMLDAPVFARGQMIGVVCHEHVGEARRWEFWDNKAHSVLAFGSSAEASFRFIHFLTEACNWEGQSRPKISELATDVQQCEVGNAARRPQHVPRNSRRCLGLRRASGRAPTEAHRWWSDPEVLKAQSAWVNP